MPAEHSAHGVALRPMPAPAGAPCLAFQAVPLAKEWVWCDEGGDEGTYRPLTALDIYVPNSLVPAGPAGPDLDAVAKIAAGMVRRTVEASERAREKKMAGRAAR